MKRNLWAVAALSFALLRPVYAYLPPDLSQRRTQLVQLLPFAEVTRLQAWLTQQSGLLSPAEYLEKLHSLFRDTSVA